MDTSPWKSHSLKGFSAIHKMQKNSHFSTFIIAFIVIAIILIWMQDSFGNVYSALGVLDPFGQHGLPSSSFIDHHSDGMIQVQSPQPGSTISNPVVVSGLAQGTWFSEGSFPVIIVDSSGNQIGSGVATSTQDVVTNNFIPFSATVTWVRGTNTSGTITLERNNPSGSPENDASIDIPVNFGN
jgi:hypothetical protein